MVSQDFNIIIIPTHEVQFRSKITRSHLPWEYTAQGSGVIVVLWIPSVFFTINSNVVQTVWLTKWNSQERRPILLCIGIKVYSLHIFFFNYNASICKLLDILFEARTRSLKRCGQNYLHPPGETALQEVWVAIPSWKVIVIVSHNVDIFNIITHAVWRQDLLKCFNN